MLNVISHTGNQKFVSITGYRDGETKDQLHTHITRIEYISDFVFSVGDNVLSIFTAIDPEAPIELSFKTDQDLIRFVQKITG